MKIVKDKERGSTNVKTPPKRRKKNMIKRSAHFNRNLTRIRSSLILSVKGRVFHIGRKLPEEK